MGFQNEFKMACENKEVYEGAAIWLFQYFMRRSVIDALTVCLPIKTILSPHSVKEDVLKMHCQVVDYLLET